MHESSHLYLQFLFLYSILKKQWRKLFLIPFLLSAISAGIVLTIPKSYESQTIIFIPTSTLDLGGMEGMAEMMGLNSKLSQGQGEIDRENLALTLLGTKDILVPIAKELKLDSIWELDSTSTYLDHQILKTFNNMITVEISDENAFQISFRDENPVLATTVLDTLINRLNIKMIQTEKATTKERMAFIEKQKNETKTLLTNAEAKLATFQKESNFIGAETLIEGLISHRVELESQLLSHKMKLDVSKAKYGVESQNYRELNKEFNAMKSAKLNNKDAIFLNQINNLPEKAQTYITLKRELSIYEKTFELLSIQLSQLQIESVKELKNIVVIQPPWVNWKRVSPPRTIVVLFVGSISFIFLFVFFAIRKNISEHYSTDEEFRNRAKQILNN